MDPFGATWRTIEVDRLEDLSPNDLREVSTVVFHEKGAASHVEVICRIRGIELIPFSMTAETFDSQLSLPKDVVEFFQVSISGASELEGIDLSIVSDVFVRLEHLLYQAVWEDRNILDFSRRDDLRRSLLHQLRSICQSLPDRITMLVRGLDLRSDDLALAPLRRSSAEANPELGLHGASWLLENPAWTEFEAGLLTELDRINLAYGIPFVRGVKEFYAFQTHFGALFPTLVPFIEAPASLLQFSRCDLPTISRVSIGLKDLAQFFFAVDRANASVAQYFDFTEPSFVEFIGNAAVLIGSQGTGLSVYQQPDTLKVYAARLSSITWIPSVPAGAMREIG